MSKMKPTYQHDCKECNFIGSMHTNMARNIADWYECGESVIARLGDEGSDYWSMPKDLVMDDKYLTATRAKGSAVAYVDMNILARFMLERANSLTMLGTDKESNDE